MEQFQSDDIELIWGMGKDHNLEEGEVKVTVLATGFGMKDIPDMKPLVEEEEKVAAKLNREEMEKREKEEKELKSMAEAFYKPNYKVFIFKGEEMYNEELLTAIDNSPTYNRTASDLEEMEAIMNKPAPEIKAAPATVTEAEEVAEIEENHDNNTTEE